MKQQRKLLVQKNSLKVGHAGELFTCFTAIMDGYDAHRVSGQRAFDVLIEHNKNLYKVQVKTSRYRDNNRPSLTFQLRRRVMDYSSKKSIDVKYNKSDFDLYAFVSPDYMQVAFMPVDDIVNTYKINLNKEDFHNNTLNKAISKIDGL